MFTLKCYSQAKIQHHKNFQSKMQKTIKRKRMQLGLVSQIQGSKGIIDLWESERERGKERVFSNCKFYDQFF